MKLSFLNLIVVFFLLSTRCILAQISPGDLSRAHQNLDGIGNCTQCHEVGNEINGSRCLLCHKEIQQAITSKRGFHFSNSNKQCVSCHKEHIGRNAKITMFSENGFDHNLTGSPLTGKHIQIKCENCHNSKNIKNERVLKSLLETNRKTYFGLNNSCNSCHQPKHGNLLNDCKSCHITDSWRPASYFNHSKTKFALTGKHNDLKCEKCHIEILERSTEKQLLFRTKSFDDCKPCHTSRHPKEMLTQSCKSCHTTESFSKTNFDHLKKRFKLTGKHLDISCRKCHQNMYDQKPSFSTDKFSDCKPCHKSPHKKTLSEKECSSCHTSNGWSNLITDYFDHSATEYKLEGRHKELDCRKCHTKGKNNKFPERFYLKYGECSNCHADYHNGEFLPTYNNYCSKCHTVSSFRPSTFGNVEHDKSRFSLRGGHLATPCIKCHNRNGEEKMRFHFTDIKCTLCHQNPHKEQFIDRLKDNDCDICHNTDKWEMETFDHSKIGFTVTGKHSKLSCNKCHKQIQKNGSLFTQYSGISHKCQNCHEDIHMKQFEINNETGCALCHTTLGWQDLIFDHNKQSSFRLEGKHAQVICSGCHFKENLNSKFFIRFKPLKKTCESCHTKKENKND